MPVFYFSFYSQLKFVRFYLTILNSILSVIKLNYRAKIPPFLNSKFYEFEWIHALFTTFMYKNSCGFVCEDFPKENQTLQTRNDL